MNVVNEFNVVNVGLSITLTTLNSLTTFILLTTLIQKAKVFRPSPSFFIACKRLNVYLPQQESGQFSTGQGMSQQASVAAAVLPDCMDGLQQLPDLENAKAMPAESRIAAASASDLFFMI